MNQAYFSWSQYVNGIYTINLEHCSSREHRLSVSEGRKAAFVQAAGLEIMVEIAHTYQAHQEHLAVKSA